MELFLSKQEYEIIQIAAIVWGAFHCWYSLVNFSRKFPNTSALIRNLLRGERRNPPPQNNAQPENNHD